VYSCGRIVEALARLDAAQDLLGGAVLGGGVMAVVAGDQGDVELLRQGDQLRLQRGVPGLAVVENLDVEVGPLLVPEGDLLGFRFPAGEQQLRDLAFLAAAEDDEAVHVRLEHGLVHPGLVVESLGEPATDQLDQVFVALLGLAEGDEAVAVGVAGAAVLVVFGDVELAADDGLQLLALGGVEEVHRPVHDAVVGQGQGRHLVLDGALDQVLQAGGAVEQRVFGMDVQMDEGHGGIRR
jgi:hypothetical protein